MRNGENGRPGTVQEERWAKVQQIWTIIDRLRGENGCPWDRKQTPETVQTYLVEEAHEAAAAVRAGDREEAAEELGDLLFMVFFMIHLYEEEGHFSLERVAELITEKMVRRHPHVFGDVSVRSAEDVRDNWQKIKEKEKKGKQNRLDVPRTLPALIRAYRLLRRMEDELAEARDREDLVENIHRKLVTLKKEEADVSGDRISWLGALLFDVVRLCRGFGCRPEDCLHHYLDTLEESWAASDEKRRS